MKKVMQLLRSVVLTAIVVTAVQSSFATGIGGCEVQFKKIETTRRFSEILRLDRTRTVQVRPAAIQKFVELGNGRSLYTDYQPAPAGRPTLVIFNGLTYDTASWDAYVNAVDRGDLGILRFDFRGMGKTLSKNGFPQKAINDYEQVEDVSLLLKALGIQEKVYIVGLSYGGAIALQFAARYPQKVADYIPAAPFLEALKSQDSWVRMQMAMFRMFAPMAPISEDALYDYYYRLLVYSTYPAADPAVLKGPYNLEGVYRMGQGIRKFRALAIGHQLPKGLLHSVIPRQDEYITVEDQVEFWKSLPPNRHASMLLIEGSRHRIPEDAPELFAAWTREIMSGNPLLTRGLIFKIDTSSKKVLEGVPHWKVQYGASMGHTFDLKLE